MQKPLWGWGELGQTGEDLSVGCRRESRTQRDIDEGICGPLHWDEEPEGWVEAQGTHVWLSHRSGMVTQVWRKGCLSEELRNERCAHQTLESLTLVSLLLGAMGSQEHRAGSHYYVSGASGLDSPIQACNRFSYLKVRLTK